MGWATNYIVRLHNGKTIKFRPHGNSMSGRIESGQLCTVMPIASYSDLCVGDIVLCKVNGHEYLHIIKAIQGERFLIGNNHGKTNGWTNQRNIFGKLINIEK